MISSPLLVHEKIWLDKPKYDAAERRYYERLAKSSESSKVANSTIVTDQDNADLSEGQDVQVSMNDSCPISGVMSTSKIHLGKLNNSEDALIKEGKIDPCSTQLDEDIMKHELSNLNESICPKTVHYTPEVKDASLKQVIVLSDGSKQPVSESGAQATANRSKSVLINKGTENESSCSPQTNKVEVGSKSEKPKKSDVNSRDNILPKGEVFAQTKIETGDITCSKGKVQNKTKIADDKGSKQEFVPDKRSCIDPVSDVVKLKGYYLPSKNLSYPSDSLKNKGTNVNTIPEISKITTCYEKSKNSQNNYKKVPLTARAPLPDIQDSVELIIPSDSINDPQAEDQAKKESKKKKRHKKERQRDKKGVSQNSNSWNSLAGEVAKARQHIKNSLQCIDDIAVTSNTVSVEITNRLNSLEKENVDLKDQVSELVELLKKMDLRISSLEKTCAGGSKPTDTKAPAPAPHPKKDDAEDDDGVDLFGSDSEEEDTEAAKIKEQRLAEYAARKAKKPVLIAKSNIILDVKPWDDETNMKELEAEVRKITTDGLVWGASKLVPLAYGIHKLQISCVVEDDKVSVDWLQETIQEIEDYVQSVDIAAFNKV